MTPYIPSPMRRSRNCKMGIRRLKQWDHSGTVLYRFLKFLVQYTIFIIFLPHSYVNCYFTQEDREAV